jgi:hypothetical protein
MAWVTPITDWDGISTGRKYYNFGDSNRVEGNTYEISLLLIAYFTPPTLAAIVTSRTNLSFDYYDDINRVESNILALKTAFVEPPGWITPVTNRTAGVLYAFGYTEANRLEIDLLLLYELITGTISYFQYPGMFYAGQDNTYL